jgi:hypothetical protein
MVKEGICVTMHAHTQRLMTLTLTMMVYLIHAKGLTMKIIHPHVSSLGGKKVVEFSKKQTLLTRIQPYIKYVDIDVVSVVAVTVTTVVC